MTDEELLAWVDGDSDFPAVTGDLPTESDCRFIAAAHAAVPRLIAEKRALEQRIRELTEWRPMETAPMDGTVFLVVHHDAICFCEWDLTARPPAWMIDGFLLRDGEVSGWLPLPEVKP